MNALLKLSKIFFVIVGIIIISNSSYGQTVNNIHDKFVVVLDVQREYTEHSLSADEAQKLIDSINYVIEKSDPNKIIYVLSVHRMLNISFAKPFIYASNDTSAKWNMDSRVNIVNDNIFSKGGINVFDVKEITDFLEQNNAKKVVIIGLLAEECVYSSSIGGYKLGYEMYVIPEAIAGSSPKRKAKAIKKLQEYGINLLSLSD